MVSAISEQIGILTIRLGDNLPSPQLRKKNQIKTIHSSLAIEQNTLSLKQVTDIIDGKHVLGAPDEIQEVKNAIEAYRLMPQLDAFKEKDLLRAHGLMMNDLVSNAGHYRQEGVGVFDGNGNCLHMAPPPARVPELMGDLFNWVSKTDVHPLVHSCVFHYEFEFIHPFIDGNGRMGRFWQTMLLSRWKGLFSWLPVETIVREHQQAYYGVIQKSDHAGESTPFVEFMLRCLLDAMENYVPEVDNEENGGLHDKLHDNLHDKFPQLSEKAFSVLEVLRLHPGFNADEIAASVSLSQRQVKTYINALKQAGLIVRVGSNKSGYWKVNV